MCVRLLQAVCSLLTVQSQAWLSWLLSGRYEAAAREVQNRLDCWSQWPSKITAGGIRALPKGGERGMTASLSMSVHVAILGWTQSGWLVQWWWVYEFLLPSFWFMQSPPFIFFAQVVCFSSVLTVSWAVAFTFHYSSASVWHVNWGLTQCWRCLLSLVCKSLPDLFGLDVPTIYVCTNKKNHGCQTSLRPFFVQR